MHEIDLVTVSLSKPAILHDEAELGETFSGDERLSDQGTEQRDRHSGGKSLRALALTLMVTGALCVGCRLAPGTFIEGSHLRLPGPQATTVIWGTHYTAVQLAGAWLHSQGLQVVPLTMTLKKLNERHHHLTCTRSDVPELVSVSRDLGANFVVYIESTIKPVVFRSPIRAEPAKGVAVTDTRYDIHLVIHGVDANTGELVWKGTGRTRYPVSALDASLTALTAQTLAAALGPVKEKTLGGPPLTEVRPAPHVMPVESLVSCPQDSSKHLNHEPNPTVSRSLDR